MKITPVLCMGVADGSEESYLITEGEMFRGLLGVTGGSPPCFQVYPRGEAAAGSSLERGRR